MPCFLLRKTNAGKLQQQGRTASDAAIMSTMTLPNYEYRTKVMDGKMYESTKKKRQKIYAPGKSPGQALHSYQEA